MKIYCLIIVILCINSTAFSQGVNPLEPEFERRRIGVEIGLSSVWQSGTYLSGCGRFEKGAQINPVIEIAYDHPLIENMRFEAIVGYQNRSLSSTYNSREDIPIFVRTVANEDTSIIRVPVTFENLGVAKFSYIVIQPGIKFYLTKALYVGGAIGGNILISHSTQHIKNILSKTVDINGIGLSEVSFLQSESSNPYSKIYSESSTPVGNAFTIDGVLMIGSELQLSRRWFFGPRLTWTLPFTPSLQNPLLSDDLFINTLQFTLGVRYSFK
ncbi:MAG: hypothetical protein IPP08_08750 [Chlorobiota bacterium]|nr:hypothetical protein [Chlorobiota bacterium]QQS65860.1 MAG: hypothetical protein IPP08_08750 [Chlorobiota bacterium]